MHAFPLFFPVADGSVLRLRLPGGRIPVGGWEQLADLAESGDGQVQLTSRGNLQVRGVDTAGTPPGNLAGTGFSPGPSIIASPLARLDPLVDALEIRLARTAASSRLLLGVDDGSGDILAERPDLGLQVVESGARLIEHGQLVGEPQETALLLDQIAAAASDCTPQSRPARAGSGSPLPPVGWLPAADGSVTLGAGLPLGMLDAKVARMLGVIDVETTATPWRSLLIHDLSESVAEQVVRVLAPLGLIFDANSPLLRVSACIGLPSCRHALSDVRADALQAAVSGAPGRLHFVGCARNCGRPRQEHTLYQATGDGEYEVLEP